MLCVWPIQSIEEIINQSPLLSENQRLLSCVWYSCRGFRSRKSVPEDSVGSTVDKQRDFTVVGWTIGTTWRTGMGNGVLINQYLHLFLSEVSSINFPFFFYKFPWFYQKFCTRGGVPSKPSETGDDKYFGMLIPCIIIYILLHWFIYCMCANMWKSETACGNAFFPAMCVPEIKPQASGLAASSSPHWVTSPAPSNVFLVFIAISRLHVSE